MKRFTIAAAAVCLSLCALFLGGCEKEVPAPETVASDLSSAFTSNAHITYKELELDAKIDRSAPGFCNLEIMSPEALSGMKILWQNNDVVVEYRGLKTSFDPSSVPGRAIVKSVVTALDAAARTQGMEVSMEGKVFTVKGESGGGSFLIQLDPDNGDILNLSIPDMELKAEFTNFQFLK